MDQLVIRRNKRHESTVRKPLMISADVYDRLEALVPETGYVKGILGDMLLEFALERLVIEDPKEE